MHALTSVFADRSRPLLVGSVKTNIGHAEAAAGVAGLIKAVQMLRHQALPPTLHFRRLNPHIDLRIGGIRVPTTLTPAPIDAIGVSSFGFSGTNAHIVLQRAPAEAKNLIAMDRPDGPGRLGRQWLPPVSVRPQRNRAARSDHPLPGAPGHHNR